MAAPSKTVSHLVLSRRPSFVPSIASDCKSVSEILSDGHVTCARLGGVQAASGISRIEAIEYLDCIHHEATANSH